MFELIAQMISQGGGGLLGQAAGMGGALKAGMSDPLGALGEQLMGTQFAKGLQNPANFFEDQMADIAQKIRDGKPLTGNEMAKMQAFQRQGIQTAKDAEEFVRLPTGGFLNPAQQRLIR